MNHAAHPCEQQPDHALWRQAVEQTSAQGIAAVDPVVHPRFPMSRRARIATAGSCFAQPVARHLRRAGIPPFVTEEPHPTIRPGVAREFGDCEFCARYGNVYTSRRLLQLMLRAFGEFKPADDAWQGQGGGWLDPFRPPGADRLARAPGGRGRRPARDGGQ